jgi:hypothetical protein
LHIDEDDLCAFGRHAFARQTSPRASAARVVRDANGQALAYLYCRDSDAKVRQAKVLTKDEARRIAAKRGAVAGAGGEGRGLIPSGDKGHVTEVASQAPVCTRKRTRFAKGLGSGFGTGRLSRWFS